MIKRIVVATYNKGKFLEISNVFKNHPKWQSVDVISLSQLGITESIKETGSSFEENAIIKATEIFKICGEMVIADDSGLQIDALNGEPGIYSARFAGENATDYDRCKMVLNLLSGVKLKKRTARFVCSIALAFSKEKYFTVNGLCDGYIAEKPAGDNGFGYDPIFFIPEYNMTLAQMEVEQKNIISHRGRALRLLEDILSEITDD